MLVVNCSYESGDLQSYVDNNLGTISPAIILDFASTFNKGSVHTVIYPADIDDQNKQHHLALTDFITQMGKFSRAEIYGGSGRTIRSLTFHAIPLYWFTNISEKHPGTSPLKKLYYLKYLYPLLNYQGNEIAFVLPANASHFISAINEYVRLNMQQIKKVLFNIKEPFKGGMKEHLINVFDFFKKVVFVRRQIKDLALPSSTPLDTLIYTYYPQTWRDELNGDYVLHEVANYSNEGNNKTAYALFFFDYYGLKGIKLRENWDPLFFRSFPSLYQILQFHIKLALVFPQIRKMKLKREHIDFLNSEVLFFELSYLLKHKREYLFNYIWFSKYFKRLEKSTRVFYQDEFYLSGRVISAACKNSKNTNIKTYGVQHGLFYEAHTIYAITNDEINPLNKQEGMPMPGKFIVWGDYFKKLFLKNNSTLSDYVISAGNPNYTKLQANIKNDPGKSGPLRILWCTTNKIDVMNQYKNIISGFLDRDKNSVITVRCHPQLNYIKLIRDELATDSQKERMNYSEFKNIYEDIQDSDVVLTSSGSTVFLDAMVCKKPVLKLVNDDYYMGDLGKKEMKTIYTASDLLNEVNEISSRPSHDIEYSDLLNTDPLLWRKLFQKNVD